MPDKMTMDSSGFVLLADFVPQIVQEIRYYSTYNFIGDRIDGYEEPCAILTREAARALREAANELCAQGYRLKVFDAYRPACAVKHFQLWGMEDMDLRMKEFFYPEVEKQDLFKKGYTGKEVDMGSPFDLFSERSHPDCKDVSREQFQNRMFLQDAMTRNGFVPLDCEWWHFTLKDEPYPDTYFEFPVSSAYLRKE